MPRKFVWTTAVPLRVSFVGRIDSRVVDGNANRGHERDGNDRAISGTTPPRLLVRKRANMAPPNVVDTTFQRKFLHMGVPSLKTRERKAVNLGESRLNLPAN
jgi:hypothetical protein